MSIFVIFLNSCKALRNGFISAVNINVITDGDDDDYYYYFI